MGPVLLLFLAVVLAAAAEAGGGLEGEPREAAPPELSEVPALRITQRTRGLPGSDADGGAPPITQVLTVDEEGKRLRLEDRASDDPARVTRVVILRLDRAPPVLWEVAPSGEEYREHRGDLNRLQRDRRVAEIQEIRIAKSYPAAKREQFFRENPWLRPDGSRVVAVEKREGAMVLGRECERVVVTENGREILDARIARDLPGARRSYFHLYRRLGAFSEEVLEKLSDLEGLPLKAKITVVTALPVQVLEVEALEVVPAKVSAALFEPPPGARKVEDVPQEVACARCAKKLPPEPDRIPAKYRRKDGTYLYFCSEGHLEEWLDAQPGGR